MPNETEQPASLKRFNLKHLLQFVTITCVLVALLGPFLMHEWNSRGHPAWKRASPFTDVQVNDDRVMVEFNESQYELVSINEASTEEILRSAKHAFGWSGVKRFVEDLPQVLGAMGMPDEDYVDLVLKDSEGQLLHFAEAPMTVENRYKVTRRNRRYSDIDPRSLTLIGVPALWLLYSLGKDAKKVRESRKRSAN